MAEKQRVIYATSGWCIHDTRWFTALQDNGLDPIAVSVTDDLALLPEGSRAYQSAEDLRNGVDELLETQPIPILAGPLTTITRDLMGANTRIVGLSWGWDLQPEAIGEEFDADELAWVSDLDALIVDSIVTEQVAINLGLDPARISNIPWGIDVDLFTPDGPKADLSRWGVEPGDRVILSLRSHTPIHRTADVIEAFARALPHDPSLFLIMGGDGPLLDANREIATRLGIDHRVRFVGTLPEHDLPGLLRAAEVYVSATEVDGTSVTLLQALACATPVIVSNIPGNLPWLHDECSSIFPVRDVDSLSRRLRDQQERSELKEASLRHAAEVRNSVNWRANTAGIPALLMGAAPGVTFGKVIE